MSWMKNVWRRKKKKKENKRLLSGLLEMFRLKVFCRQWHRTSTNVEKTPGFGVRNQGAFYFSQTHLPGLSCRWAVCQHPQPNPLPPQQNNRIRIHRQLLCPQPLSQSLLKKLLLPQNNRRMMIQIRLLHPHLLSLSLKHPPPQFVAAKSLIVFSLRVVLQYIL